MGCFHAEKRPEEYVIYSFFHKMERENTFELTIEKYDEMYDKILTLSSNNFKKLEKKQRVRIGFVIEIMKNINKNIIGEKEDLATNKILFYTIVLTLTLEKYIKESRDSLMNNSNSNDLQQFLLTIVIRVLNRQFNPSNLKNILFYLAKMLSLLFHEIKDIDQYINIDKYVATIERITEHEILLNKEVYSFIKVNLICLGEYFNSINHTIALQEDYIDLLIKYYIQAYDYNYNFIIEYFNTYKKFLNYENNGIRSTNINNLFSTILYTTDMNYNPFKNITTLKTIKTIKTIKTTANVCNSNLITNTNNNNNNNVNDNSSSFIIVPLKTNNMYSRQNTQCVPLNTQTQTLAVHNGGNVQEDDEQVEFFQSVLFNKFIKNERYQDTHKITDSLYSFLRSIIEDSSKGKFILKSLNQQVKNLDKKKFFERNINNIRISRKQSGALTKNSQNEENECKLEEILLLSLFTKCQKKKDKLIIMTFIEFITDKLISDEMKCRDLYYDVMIKFFNLINIQTTKDKIISLLTQIFIYEIETKITKNFFIDKVLELTNFIGMGDSGDIPKLKILMLFLINISSYFKEIQDVDLRIDVLTKMTDILNRYIKNNNMNNKGETPDLTTVKSENYIKYKLKKEDLYTIFENFELTISNKESTLFQLQEDNFIGSINKEENCKYQYPGDILYINYIEFTIVFLRFIGYNFIFSEIYKELKIRSTIMKRLLDFISSLECFLINQDFEQTESVVSGKEKEQKQKTDCNYILDIIGLIKIIITMIKINTIDGFYDSQILYKYLGENLLNLPTVINNNKDDISIFAVKLIYTILIFILIQLKNIFRIPNSMHKLHQEVITYVKKCNELCSKCLNQIKISNFWNFDMSKSYNELKQTLNFADNETIKTKVFKQIIEIIYSKLFGKASALITFFDTSNDNDKIITVETKNMNGSDITDCGQNMSVSYDLYQSNIIENSYQFNFNSKADNGTKQNSSFSEYIKLPIEIKKKKNKDSSNNEEEKKENSFDSKKESTISSSKFNRIKI